MKISNLISQTTQVFNVLCHEKCQRCFRTEYGEGLCSGGSHCVVRETVLQQIITLIKSAYAQTQGDLKYKAIFIFLMKRSSAKVFGQPKCTNG